MEDWTINPRQNPPPEGIIVEIKGSDYMGEWTGNAFRKDYKQGSSKAHLKRKCRWMHPNGEVFDDQAVEAWRYL